MSDSTDNKDDAIAKAILTHSELPGLGLNFGRIEQITNRGGRPETWLAYDDGSKQYISGIPDGREMTFEMKYETALTRPPAIEVLTMEQIIALKQGFKEMAESLRRQVEIDILCRLSPPLPVIALPERNDQWLIPMLYGTHPKPTLNPFLMFAIDNGGGPLQTLTKGIDFARIEFPVSRNELRVAFKASKHAFRYIIRYGRYYRRDRKHHSKGYRKHIREQKRLGLWEE